METSSDTRGIVASGHPQTSRAARQILRQGGNAFDAAVAALLTACVAEPILTSLGGGGFLLAESADGQRSLFDFFAQTPSQQRHGDIEFYPIAGDFGATTQEFHIGMGSVAVPGMVAGLFAIQRRLCQLPMSELASPAIELATRGVEINPFQAYIQRILEPILRSRPDLENLFTNSDGHLIEPPNQQRQPALADSIDRIARLGPDEFYQGEIGHAMIELAREHGGHLRATDLASYENIIRKPLEFSYRGARIHTNPVPSCGGTLIAHSLSLLDRLADPGSDPDSYRTAFALVMAATNQARLQTGLQQHADTATASALLDPGGLDAIRQTLARHPLSSRGTTQISVVDAMGNIASVTSSNGEGSGYLIPDTGIHLNNFLGEQDLMPQGFNDWPRGRRMSSMMAPTIVDCADGRRLALGSGGSNRLRTAIAQVLIQLLAFDRPLSAAVNAPRMHLEDQRLSIEPGLSPSLVAALRQSFPELQRWDQTNLFFGGVHIAALGADRQSFDGYGDPRRGGVCLQA